MGRHYRSIIWVPILNLIKQYSEGYLEIIIINNFLLTDKKIERYKTNQNITNDFLLLSVDYLIAVYIITLCLITK